MPSFDGGHYFLTVLIPVRIDAVADPRTEHGVTSHLHALREVLAAMPTAQQSPATEASGLNSPFARNPRTHFARLFVVDEVAFNGRGQRDPIKVALVGPPPSQFDPVDRLEGAWLAYVTDFDAADGESATIDAYLADLFRVMEPEWRDILQHCHGYDRVDGPDGFAKLIRACEIETTMPFNDYWARGLSLTPLNLKPFIHGAAGGAAALLLGLLLAIFIDAGWLWLSLLGLLAVVVAAGLAFVTVSREGAKPLPTAPRSDLPSVLKALYVQQNFTRFAIAQQGAPPDALHEAFGAFLAEHRPADVMAPTQARGVVRS